jgi:ElaB/YqjD/DUF883 family membrane-anchored ribosome-binding protein
MDWLESRTIKSISIIVLFFFTWTFGGGFDIAYAINDSSKGQVASRKSKEQKPEQKLQKVLEDIEQILKDTTTDTGTKKNKLKTKKADIAKLDKEIKKQFKETEKKLIDAGLLDEILQRHYDFVKKYEENLQELITNL